jgi:pyrophosphatase PpaX
VKLLSAKLRAVLADFDDTLMATRRRRLALLLSTLADFGKVVDESTVEQYWGAPFRQLIEGFAPDVKYEDFFERYSEAMLRHPPSPQDGSRRLLMSLKQRNVLVVVITSGSHQLVEQDLKAGALDEFVDVLVGFEDTNFHKPDPRVLDLPFEELARRGIDPSETLYIGDSPADFSVATARRVSFIAVTSGSSTEHEFTRMGLSSDNIVRSLSELVVIGAGGPEGARIASAV